MTWIDSTKLLITEKKTAQIILFDTSNNTSKIISHKIPVASWGQGGLLDIISEGNNIWITCSIMKNKLLTTAVYKSTLNNNSLIDSELIFEATPYINNAKHFGSRITIKDDFLYMNEKKLITLNITGQRLKKQNKMQNQNMKSLSNMLHRIFNQIKVINTN